jgi:hypothetical protein
LLAKVEQVLHMLCVQKLVHVVAIFASLRDDDVSTKSAQLADAAAVFQGDFCKLMRPNAAFPTLHKQAKHRASLCCKPCWPRVKRGLRSSRATPPIGGKRPKVCSIITSWPQRRQPLLNKLQPVCELSKSKQIVEAKVRPTLVVLPTPKPGSWLVGFVGELHELHKLVCGGLL